MFQPIEYSVSREGTIISLMRKNEKLTEIFVDPTDNRLTIKSMNVDIPLEAVRVLTTYLDENFGAKQIFEVPTKEVQEKFCACGFKIATPESRIQVTSLEALSNINSGLFPNLEFLQGEAIQNTSKENIKALAQGSGFLKSKIEQYEKQGYPGFQLMCDYSIPFGVRNESGKLLAFCRITKMDSGSYYLGDTFVDEQTFGNKQMGTAYLYQQLGKACRDNLGKCFVYLIAPPDRVDEFEKQYGCSTPSNVVFKFSAPKPELANVFSEEQRRIEEKLAKKTYGLNKHSS